MMASIHWRWRASLPKRGGLVFAVGPDQVRLEIVADERFEVPPGETLIAKNDLPGADQVVIALPAGPG